LYQQKGKKSKIRRKRKEARCKMLKDDFGLENKKCLCETQTIEE